MWRRVAAWLFAKLATKSDNQYTLNHKATLSRYSVSKLMPSDIAADVAEVLKNAARGDGNHPYFLTAYQILDRLPKDIRDRLINERTAGGHGAGTHYSAPSAVSDAAEMLPGIIVDYIDNRGLKAEIAGKTIEAGFEVCGIYRLADQHY